MRHRQPTGFVPVVIILFLLGLVGVLRATFAAQLLAGLDFLAERTPLAADEAWSCAVVDARFLRELVNYVIYRNL